MRGGGIVVAVDRCSAVFRLGTATAGIAPRGRQLGKGIPLCRFDCRDGPRRGIDHVKNASKGIGIAVEILGRDRGCGQVCPSVACRLQFLDPGPALARKSQPLRKLKPVLVDNAQERGEIQLLQRVETTLSHGALLLEAQAVLYMSYPPVVAQGRQVDRKESGDFSGCCTKKLVHAAFVWSWRGRNEVSMSSGNEHAVAATGPNVPPRKPTFHRLSREMSRDGRAGRSVTLNELRDRGVSRYWAGLSVLARFCEADTEISSEEVRKLLGTRSVKGIGAALSGTRNTLYAAGIRLDEVTVRKTVRGRSLWTGGPRIRQAMHVLEQERYRWGGGEQDDVPIEEAEPGEPGPVLVLRALKSRGDVYSIEGGMAELDEFLDDDRLEIEEAGSPTIGEIFAAWIEPDGDGREHAVPDGYRENGIWVRGKHDYADPRVPGAIGTGLRSTMIALVSEATWVERRIRLVDVGRQVAKIRAKNSRSILSDAVGCWRNVERDFRFRHVNWIGARGIGGPLHAPPLRMRLRCWYEAVIATANGRRVVLREEGLRGDDARTASRAIGRWRERQGKAAGEPVAVREFRIARRQPRPMPIDD